MGNKNPTTDLATLTCAIRVVNDPPRIYDRFASNAIGEITRTTSGSLVCMTTRGRDGLARLTGSVAEDVLRQVDAPVLLVGPGSVADPTAGGPGVDLR